MGEPVQPIATEGDYVTVVNVCQCIRNKSTDDAAREVAFHREQCESAARADERARVLMMVDAIVVAPAPVAHGLLAELRAYLGAEKGGGNV